MDNGRKVFVKMNAMNTTYYRSLYNRKQRYSLNVEAVCDCCYQLIDVKLFLGKWKNYIPSMPKEIKEDEDIIPVFLRGDPAYPLMSFWMKEYASTVQEQYFGISLCRARIDIECAFGHLQGWSSALLRPLDINLAELTIVIYVCFVQNKFL